MPESRQVQPEGDQWVVVPGMLQPVLQIKGFSQRPGGTTGWSCLPGDQTGAADTELQKLM